MHKLGKSFGFLYKDRSVQEKSLKNNSKKFLQKLKQNLIKI